jgi:uncharacterized membrane protein YhhN
MSLKEQKDCFGLLVFVLMLMAMAAIALTADHPWCELLVTGFGFIAMCLLLIVGNR